MSYGTVPVTYVRSYGKFTTLLFCFPRNSFSIPKKVRAKMGNYDEKTNTGEGVKGKRGRTVSDDVGGKSLSETSKSVCGQCVGERTHA